MKLALCQISLSNNFEDNLKKSLACLKEVASQKADLVCFPELQLSPFFPQHQGADVDKYLISIENDFIKSCSEICRQNNLVAVTNFYLQQGQNKFDASPMINSDGKILGISKMVHIVQAPCFYEQDYYTASDSGFEVYDTTKGKVGVVICFDRHYPESLRTCALKGAQIIIIPTANIKTEPLELFEWELRVPAMQNGLFIAMCNRVGQEDQMDFCGESVVVDPYGEIVVKANDLEKIIYAEIDLNLVTKARKDRPYLELRRPNAYWK